MESASLEDDPFCLAWQQSCALFDPNASEHRYCDGLNEVVGALDSHLTDIQSFGAQFQDSAWEKISLDVQEDMRLDISLNKFHGSTTNISSNDITDRHHIHPRTAGQDPNLQQPTAIEPKGPAKLQKKASPLRNRRIPLDAKHVLECKFQTTPYPTKEDIESLAGETNLDLKTVRNFFNNARARRAGPEDASHHQQESSSPVNEVDTPDDIPFAKLTQKNLDAIPMCHSNSSKDSIERFLAEPPDVDEELSFDNHWNLNDWLLNDDENLFWTSTPKDDTGSVFSSDTQGTRGTLGTRGTCGSDGSAYSRKSRGSYGRAARQGLRLSRWMPYRSKPKVIIPIISGQTTVDEKYECTFCDKSFKRKAEWKRHEETVHVPVTSWICTPSCKDPDEMPTKCPYCTEKRPSKTHLDTHAYYSCAAKHISERTFTRKDHLIQHLRRVHGASHTDIKRYINSWKAPGLQLQPNNDLLICGFCNHKLPSWRDRVDHVADHFERGDRISGWSRTHEQQHQRHKSDPHPCLALLNPPSESSSRRISSPARLECGNPLAVEESKRHKSAVLLAPPESSTFRWPFAYNRRSSAPGYTNRDNHCSVGDSSSPVCPNDWESNLDKCFSTDNQIQGHDNILEKWGVFALLGRGIEPHTYSSNHTFNKGNFDKLPPIPQDVPRNRKVGGG